MMLVIVIVILECVIVWFDILFFDFDCVICFYEIVL